MNLGQVLQDAVAAETRRVFAAALQSADDAWQDQLVTAFGSQAGDARYDERGRGEEGTPLRAAYEAREAARIKWEAVR